MISENNNDTSKNLINIIDILGRQVTEKYKNLIVFYIYDDGSIEKKYLLK